jgi:hypothetical protein
MAAGVLVLLMAASAGATPLRIHVLSNRADLISGGQALVSVSLPRHTRPRSVHMWLNGRNVTREFARRRNHLYEGVVQRLHRGRNTLVATLPNRRGARITITNHPIGGPVFSGPQAEPWTCEPGARDPKCDRKTSYSYLYQPQGSNSLQPYNPSSPPSNVSTTTTETGATVPFIVREQISWEDRDEVRTETLWQLHKRWKPWAPQTQWNHKLYLMHGFDCHDTYGVTTPPWGDAAGLIPSNPAVPDSSETALGLGYIVSSTSLDNSAADCNPAVQAESLLMDKEHIIDQYGTLKYTIGYGCSGGSLAEQWVANAYPGIYQGLIAQCAFPDAGSSAQQILDYEALGNYFSAANKANPLAWTSMQEGEVDGTAVWNFPNPQDATFSAQSFFPFALPANCTDYASSHSYISSSEVYNPQTHPGGVRCGLLDWTKTLLGLQPKSVWDKQEQEVGHGFGASPIDNVGVQYGLNALEKKQISPAQFADLNAKIGSFNIDWQPVPQRVPANQPALARAYRTGVINQANNLNQVPIIDLMGPNDPGLAHDTFRAFALRDRLIRDFGTGANMVIWQGPATIIGDVQYTNQALKAMDGWLDRVMADRSHRSLPSKVISDKPGSIHDQCSNGDGTVVLNTLCPQAEVPVYGTPRTVAGEPLTTDQNKCRLVPLNRSSYNVTFTASEWAELEKTFPNGVCDYAKPGVSQQNTVPWLTYLTSRNKVVYGGRRMPRAPVSRGCRVVSRRPGVCR